MNTNKITVVARRSCFEPPAANALANPASPTVLQGLMQILADLERKVDALATRPQQMVEPSTRDRLALSSASPTALQTLMQTLTELEQKVDALATRPRQEVRVVPRRTQTPLPEEVQESEDMTMALAEGPKARIDLSRLLRFFE